ncbi:hypothetical protein Q9L58_009026 [Maublancomyces gigas]|uniref:Uncharacterized protein n=1 Tax=Discina gigas TaxID=1032678 RepID=A0ABR3G815_9PEZI
MDKNHVFENHPPLAEAPSSAAPISEIFTLPPQMAALTKNENEISPQSRQNSSRIASSVAPYRTQMTSAASVEDIIATTKQSSDVCIQDSGSDGDEDSGSDGDEDSGSNGDEDSCSDEDEDGSEKGVGIKSLSLPTEFPLAANDIVVPDQSTVTSTQTVHEASCSVPASHHIEEFSDEALYAELAWCLESDEEGSIQSEIDWDDDGDEDVYWPRLKSEDEDRDYVYSDSEQAQVFTTEELQRSGRRVAPLRKLPRAHSPTAASDPGSPQGTNYSSGNTTPPAAAAGKTPRNTMDSISPCLNTGVAVPRQQNSVETNHTLLHAASNPGMNCTNDLLKPQVESQGEYEKIFAAFNDLNGERTTSAGEDWQTILSRAGVTGIPIDISGATNAFPMFESDANHLLAPGNIPHCDDFGMGDFGWLDDHPVDWNAVLDPELAKADHLAKMANIAASGGAVMESSGVSVNDTHVTTFNAIIEGPEAQSVFDRFNIDLILSACNEAFGSTASPPEFGSSDIVVEDYVKTYFSPLMVPGGSENMATSEPEDWNLDDRISPSAILAVSEPVAHSTVLDPDPILQPDSGFSSSQSEASGVEVYIGSAPVPSPAVGPTASDYLAPSTFPPSDLDMQNAFNLSVLGPELMNVDDNTNNGVELYTQLRPEAMNIDVNLSSIVLRFPTAISISPQFPPENPGPDTKTDAAGAVTDMDADMIDMPHETLDVAQSTLCTPPSSPSGRDNNGYINIPVIRDTPRNQIEQVVKDAPEISMSDAPDEPTASNISTILVPNTDEHIYPLSSQNTLFAASSSIAPDNGVEQLVDGVHGISISEDDDKPLEGMFTTQVRDTNESLDTPLRQDLILSPSAPVVPDNPIEQPPDETYETPTSDSHNEPTPSKISIILVRNTNEHPGTSLSQDLLLSPSGSAMPDYQIAQAADHFPETPIRDGHNEPAESVNSTTLVHEHMNKPIMSSTPIPSITPGCGIEQVADSFLETAVPNNHHQPAAGKISQPQVLSNANEHGLTGLSHEATALSLIRISTQTDNHQTRAEADRRERKDRKQGILIRKLASQIRDLVQERLEHELAADERTQLYNVQIAGLMSQLEAQKGEEARCLNELQSRQEVEVGILAKELKAVRAKAIELRKENERKVVEYAGERVEWEKAIRKDERKMVELRKVEDEKAMTEVYKTLETPRVTWNNWPVASTAKAPVLVKNVVKNGAFRETTAPNSRITVDREAKTLGLPMNVPTNSPTLQRHLTNTLDTPYSVTFALVLIAAMGPGQLAIPYIVPSFIVLMILIWLSVRWDRRSSFSGYIVDVKRDLAPLAKGLLFALTAMVLTGLSWLKAIVIAPTRHSNLDTDISKDIGNDRMWDDLPVVRVGNVSSLVGGNPLENVGADVILRIQDPVTVMIPAENRKWNGSEGCRGYERLADTILGPVQLPLFCERYHLARGSGEVVTVAKQWVPEEMSLNNNPGISGVSETGIGLGKGALLVAWAVGVYRVLVVRNRR